MLSQLRLQIKLDFQLQNILISAAIDSFNFVKNIKMIHLKIRWLFYTQMFLMDSNKKCHNC